MFTVHHNTLTLTIAECMGSQWVAADATLYHSVRAKGGRIEQFLKIKESHSCV